jgi:hypothetical protein
MLAVPEHLCSPLYEQGASLAASSTSTPCTARSRFHCIRHRAVGGGEEVADPSLEWQGFAMELRAEASANRSSHLCLQGPQPPVLPQYTHTLQPRGWAAWQAAQQAPELSCQQHQSTHALHSTAENNNKHQPYMHVLSRHLHFTQVCTSESRPAHVPLTSAPHRPGGT